MVQKLAQPMEKFQRKMASLVEAKAIKPQDRLWKLALLYGEEWAFWKNELQEFGFSMQDPIEAVLQVEVWEEAE
ncbi:MAG: DUF4327 family protein [Cyanobacteriota bacterium]|nr:DUF4327 family protein [Cyanobacteriota bacterium]